MHCVRPVLYARKIKMKFVKISVDKSHLPCYYIEAVR